MERMSFHSSADSFFFLSFSSFPELTGISSRHLGGRGGVPVFRFRFSFRVMLVVDKRQPNMRNKKYPRLQNSGYPHVGSAQ